MGIMEWLVAAITASLFCAAVGADISRCDDGWRSMNGRCVASSTALGRLGGEGSAEGFLGARGKCDLQGASLLVITLADIPDLLASSETDDKEIYYWIGGVADQGKLSKYSQTVKVREDPDDADDGRDLCWAACFRSINNFVELTKASCQMKLNFLCERRFETDDCREASCAQGLKQRVRREVGQDPFRNVFSDPLNLGFGSINAIRNRVPIRFNPGSFQFPPHLAPITPNPMGITFPTFIGKLHPLIVVPDHQGGVVHRLDTLFASDRGDRSNLITVQPPVTPRTKSPSKGDDMDYTSSPQAVESGKVGAVTPRSERKFSLRLPAGAIPIIHDQYNGAANTVNVRTNLSFALPSASTQQAFARTTRTLEIVTQPTLVQFTTNNVNQAIRDASDKNAKGCLRNDHRFFKGSCYALIEKLDSFMGGLQACLSLSALGHSVVINDKAEDDFLRPSYMDKRASVWLGLQRRTSNSNARDAFYWIDNTPVTYSNWALHEPAKIKDCVYASFYSGRGLWFTEDCDKPLYMLCNYIFILIMMLRNDVS
ncbi:uncharacterized protein LOC125178684 [Hyalella azteca]|uniref:Uncharacterized protein LOC125178684 n=1 Tax=Hyalella azteca TaxID=294128 RepID=A0A979FS54_HYAAZ|nr:uncharacterized protein LOC125178684 [Hyalella azteca]